MKLVFSYLKDNITINVTYFLDVKVTLVIDVIVLFVESLAHTALMILNKLNTNQLNYLSLQAKFLKKLDRVTNLSSWCADYDYIWRDISLVVMGGIYLKGSDFFKFHE